MFNRILEHRPMLLYCSLALTPGILSWFESGSWWPSLMVASVNLLESFINQSATIWNRKQAVWIMMKWNNLPWPTSRNWLSVVASGIQQRMGLQTYARNRRRGGRSSDDWYGTSCWSYRRWFAWQPTEICSHRYIYHIKTLRGPRGGIILMGKDFGKSLGRRRSKGQVKMMSQLLNSACSQVSRVVRWVRHRLSCRFQRNFATRIQKGNKQVQKNAKVLAEDSWSVASVSSVAVQTTIMLMDLRSKYPWSYG